MSVVPFLPGFVSNKPVTRAIPQCFSTVNGVVFEKTRPDAPVIDSTKAVVDRALKARAMPTKARAELLATKRATTVAPAVIPVEVHFDRQVLRFNAYFQEAVHESALEAFRVRKVDILMYLVDSSIHILEAKAENSGMPQGTLLKRHKIAKRTAAGAPEEFYGWADLAIGKEITIYGRVYRIVDCDAFTRLFFKGQGIDLPEPEAVPVDAATVRTQVLAKTGPKADKHGKAMYFDKKYMEARLGKHMEGREKLRKFLDYDKKVLRFEGQWDDTGSLYGDRNSYVVSYFLADDTVEINELTVLNSGKEQFPKLLARQHLPKDFAAARAAGSYDDNQELYYHAEDLLVGSEINVLGRNILLRACDPFTRSFYETELGITQPAPLVPDIPDTPAPEIAIPPPTGYGDHEDSLGSVYALVPKPPKRDYNKLMEFDGEVYRFQASLVDPSPEDAVRRFVIQLYPQDDTLAIQEPPVRNSGVLGGKFLARGKHRKPDGSLYTAADFAIGGTVTINGFNFYLEGTDDFTKTKIAAGGAGGDTE